MSTDTTTRGLRPSAAVRGEFRAPGSKSIAQRALVIAGLCAEPVRIAGLPDGEDVRAACALLASVGVEVHEFAPGAVEVHGIAPGPAAGWIPRERVVVGESGTLARFAIAALALCGREGQRVEIEATGSLVRRGSHPLLRALRDAGVEIEREAWPIALTPMGRPADLRLAHVHSSQEISALCIALAAWPLETRLDIDGPTPSFPYVKMTLRMLDRFGMRLRTELRNNCVSIAIRGPLHAPSEPIVIEPDASLAAVALAGACLSGGEVTCIGLTLDSLQGDVRIVEHLRDEFGCRAVARADGVVASGFPQRGAYIDCHDTPDLAPVLAIVAAGAALVADEDRAVTELVGLGTLPGKESSRIEVLARGLFDAGWEVEETSKSLRIGRRSGTSSSRVVLDPRGDHRMAFAFALLGLLRDGVDVAHPECVGKSWPSFWDDLAKLGAKVEQT